MKKKLLAVSLVSNIALLSGLLWERAEHEAELQGNARTMVSADVQYIGLVAQSRSALDSAESEEAEATADLLRKFIAEGYRNIEARLEARQRAGLGQ